MLTFFFWYFFIFFGCIWCCSTFSPERPRKRFAFWRPLALRRHLGTMWVIHGFFWYVLIHLKKCEITRYSRRFWQSQQRFRGCSRHRSPKSPRSLNVACENSSPGPSSSARELRSNQHRIINLNRRTVGTFSDLKRMRFCQKAAENLSYFHVFSRSIETKYIKKEQVFPGPRCHNSFSRKRFGDPRERAWDLRWWMAVADKSICSASFSVLCHHKTSIRPSDLSYDRCL